MNTFIRAVEYWVPNDDGSLLEFGAGLYGTSRMLHSMAGARQAPGYLAHLNRRRVPTYCLSLSAAKGVEDLADDAAEKAHGVVPCGSAADKVSCDALTNRDVLRLFPSVAPAPTDFPKVRHPPGQLTHRFVESRACGMEPVRSSLLVNPPPGDHPGTVARCARRSPSSRRSSSPSPD